MAVSIVCFVCVRDLLVFLQYFRPAGLIGEVKRFSI